MKIKIIILFTSLSFTIQAQVNHVLNYSLEDDTCNIQIGMCPTHNPRWTVPHWYDPSDGYINWCSSCFGSPANEGIPQNRIGYQYARTGQCYGILWPIGAGSNVGYITGTLSDSLKANLKYCVTFYVSLADSEWWATNSVGAYFSTDSICAGHNYNVLPYTPQVENPATNFIADKINWVPVSEEFQASGGEIFITLGGFQNTTPSNTDSVGHGGTVSGENSEVQSAYYVDDVYVRMLTIANAGGREDTICNGDGVVIGKDTTTTGVSFSWLPTTGLSNPNIAQPLASPTVTTTYTLTVVNDSIHGCNVSIRPSTS